MSEWLLNQMNGVTAPSFRPLPSGLLQRKCACGNSPGFSGECTECGEQKLSNQRKIRRCQLQKSGTQQAD